MQFTISVLIKQPVDKVFSYFVRHQNLKSWCNNLVQYKPISRGGRNKEGYKGTLIYKDIKGDLEVQEVVQVAETNKRFVVELSGEGMNSRVETKFLDQSEHTKIIIHTETKLTPWIANLFALLMKGQMRKEQERDYLRLKEVLEQ